MSAPLLLGIDIGTSSVKALVLDADGRVLECTRADHELHPRPGVVEAQADGWWDATVAAIGRLTVDLSAIAAVGLSGNMSSVVLLDDAGRTLRPAPLLADPRGAEQIAALDPALRAEIEAAGGNALTTAMAAASLLWLRDAEPALLQGAAAWVSAKDLVRLRLTGAVATEPTDAANSCFLDVRTRAWRTDLIARAGLPPHVFPPLVDAADVAGHVTAAA
ncbi:FGGY family carbohydrate kinase, partial [Patulibacter sp. S7RM1-6]